MRQSPIAPLLLCLLIILAAGLSLLAGSSNSQAQTIPPVTPAPVYLPLISNNDLTALPSATAEISLTATPSVTPALHLAGTKWQLVSWGGLGSTTPVTVSTISLEFAANGQAFGNSGCNLYNSTYVVKNNTLTFGETITTLIWCSEALNRTEERYLAALKTAHEFAVTENQLTIQDDEGKSILHFTSGALTTANTPPFEFSLQMTPVTPPVVKRKGKRP